MIDAANPQSGRATAYCTLHQASMRHAGSAGVMAPSRAAPQYASGPPRPPNAAARIGLRQAHCRLGRRAEPKLIQSERNTTMNSVREAEAKRNKPNELDATSSDTPATAPIRMRIASVAGAGDQRSCAAALIRTSAGAAHHHGVPDPSTAIIHSAWTSTPLMTIGIHRFTRRIPCTPRVESGTSAW